MLNDAAIHRHAKPGPIRSFHRNPGKTLRAVRFHGGRPSSLFVSSTGTIRSCMRSRVVPTVLSLPALGCSGKLTACKSRPSSGLGDDTCHMCFFMLLLQDDSLRRPLSTSTCITAPRDLNLRVPNSLRTMELVILGQ